MAAAKFFLHGSRRYARRGCTSHLKLVKRELRTKRPTTTEQETNKQKTTNHKPNPQSKGQVRNSSRLRQPVEKGGTWGDEFSLCTQYVTITLFSDLPKRWQYQHICSSQSPLNPSCEDFCRQGATLQRGHFGPAQYCAVLQGLE